MSRYALSAPKFGEVVVGWDSPIDGFFLQCFTTSSDEDEEPAVWLPKLDLDELGRQLLDLGVTMPDLLRRVLLADQHEWQLEVLPGDPVLWRNRQCRVLEVRPAPTTSRGRVLVEHSESTEWTDTAQLLPDLQSVGVN